MVLDPCLEMEQNFVKLLKETSLEEIKGWSEKSKTIWAKRIFIGSQVSKGFLSKAIIFFRSASTNWNQISAI